jgi:Protein kinase domain
VHHAPPDDPTAFRPPEETPTLLVSEAEARSLQLTPGTTLGGRYRVVSLIGRGGMGEVYRADDLKLGQPVALKFFARRGDAQGLYDEVRVGRQVSHPNVCRLYDVADVDGHLFITMEYVDGEDLASLLRRVGRLSSEKALAVARDICAGVAAAHEKGVIHRDLKPANVMIDGRGRARVTDFGLAHFADTAVVAAGTPAYMAPEQLSGEAASIKSDIYALGLVLYEIFTGRRAFEASSSFELLKRQQNAEFTRPSLVTKEVPAAVERLITRCLDASPGARPDSVEEILRELPGGDPLAAAIAAGETPTPAMVAAAAERGELSAVGAWVWMLVCVGGLLGFTLLSGRTTLYRRVPLKSPEVLQERIDEVLAATGQVLRRVDFEASFATDVQRLRWLARRGAEGPATSPLLFVTRQSPRPLVPLNFEHRVVEDDPPLVYSGMAEVIVDSAGLLREFTIVPPQLEAGPRPAADVDWTPFFKFAALAAPLTPAVPKWSSVVDSDQKKAWIAADGTRVEAASYHGRPVSFMVISPWQTPTRMIERVETGSRVATAAGVIITIAFWVTAVILARRNLRRGQGDRRGALRVAMLLSAITLAAALLLAHHVASAWDEMVAITLTVGLALVVGAEIWIGYVAVEPLIRRRWPRMLISTTRLLAGRLRDPMVGRDILVGLGAGIAELLLRQCTAVVPGASLFQSTNIVLSGVRYVGWFIGGGLALGVVVPICVATLLVAARAVTRSTAASIIILTALSTVVMMADGAGPLWSRAIFGLLYSATLFVLLFRFGLLAYGAATFAYLFTRRVPVTLDPSAWYFGRSTFAIALLFAVALYAFFISVGGKRWLPDLIAE